MLSREGYCRTHDYSELLVVSHMLHRLVEEGIGPLIPAWCTRTASGPRAVPYLRETHTRPPQQYACEEDFAGATPSSVAQYLGPGSGPSRSGMNRIESNR
jgi:hypothetical protein